MSPEWIRNMTLLPYHAVNHCPVWLDNVLCVAFVLCFVVMAWLMVSALREDENAH